MIARRLGGTLGSTKLIPVVMKVHAIFTFGEWVMFVGGKNHHKFF